MKPEILIGDHQDRVAIPAEWLVALEKAGARAARRIVDDFARPGGETLAALDCVEVALVDDTESERVHRQFMGVEGPTDVITFEHGEIVIGVEVAQRQAEEYGEPALRELLRYLVHGLLHLAGHDDATPRERARMEAAQEEVVAWLWAGMDETGPSEEAEFTR